MKTGRIIKSVSGFYYVQSEGYMYQCRGRGVFRKQGITPYVGDYVEFEALNFDEGYIFNIHPRRNLIQRPPVANIDQVIIVMSAQKPAFNPQLLDRFLVTMEAKKIEPVIFLQKIDLVSEIELENMRDYQAIYNKAGYQFEFISSYEDENANLGDIKSYFEKRVSVMAGQSGVGKSSLLNGIDPSLQLHTDDISKSLGRGKHTTRHVKLLEVAGGLVADTPGFSTIDFRDIEIDELRDCFPEIRWRQEDCKFRSCLHNHEPKCAVKQAVTNGEVAKHRYNSYLRFLDEIYSRKPRY